MDNVFIERLWRSLKYECVYLHAFETGSELKAGLANGLRDARPPHSLEPQSGGCTAHCACGTTGSKKCGPETTTVSAFDLGLAPPTSSIEIVIPAAKQIFG